MRFMEWIGKWPAIVPAFLACPRELGYAVHNDAAHVTNVEWLGYKLCRAGPAGYRFSIGAGRHHYHGQVAVLICRPQGLQRFIAIQYGHPQIHNQYIGLKGIERTVQVQAVYYACHIMPTRRQHQFQHLNNIFIIIAH